MIHRSAVGAATVEPLDRLSLTTSDRSRRSAAMASPAPAAAETRWDGFTEIVLRLVPDPNTLHGWRRCHRGLQPVTRGPLDPCPLRQVLSILEERVVRGELAGARASSGRGCSTGEWLPTGASTKELMARMGHSSMAAAIRYQLMRCLSPVGPGSRQGRSEPS